MVFEGGICSFFRFPPEGPIDSTDGALLIRYHDHRLLNISTNASYSLRSATNILSNIYLPIQIRNADKKVHRVHKRLWNFLA